MHVCAGKDREFRAALERPTPRLGSVTAKQQPLEHVPIVAQFCARTISLAYKSHTYYFTVGCEIKPSRIRMSAAQ